MAATSRDGSRPRLELPAEALVRLVYGRIDPGHTPPMVAQGIEFDQPRRIFPGWSPTRHLI